MTDPKKDYVGPDGEPITKAEFLDLIEGADNPYLNDSPAKKMAMRQFVETHGTGKLRKQVAQVERGERTTLTAHSLGEMSDLGKRFDASWRGPSIH